ncbi:hypothetical protein [Nocardia sp. NPDC046763]|uniref:hypothetical protein n=1 Tax=Nocardia sp. NPDC046763 TaxID=3155256 RepID=UPI0033C8CEF0
MYVVADTFEADVRDGVFTHPTDLFLRAGHHPDGTRTFTFMPAPPEATSHADDAFRRIFDRTPADR